MDNTIRIIYWSGVSGLMSIGLAIVLLFLKAVLLPRNAQGLESSENTTFHRPMLFPTIITHTRMFPIRNTFKYRLLLVGVPIGFRGRLGSLLSIDEPLRQDSKGLDATITWKTMVTAWFSFDPIRYLQRGSDENGLQHKLHQFLRSQNEDPSQWPYAYLVSVPRFLLWSRSVVTWWYLYSATRQLDAVIMEINNSFNEKRNILFRVHRCLPQPGDSAASIKSAPMYTGSWKKEIFASPFERVEGEITEKFVDLLQVAALTQDGTMTITSASSKEGRHKLTTRISFAESPIDPTRATVCQMVRILLRWTMPVTLTTPRIVFQAMRIHHYLGTMKMKQKPVIRNGSVPRDPTHAERVLEQVFRQWLAFVLDHSLSARRFEVQYSPPASMLRQPVVMRSKVNSDGKEGVEDRHKLCVNALDPCFYNALAQAKETADILAEQMVPRGDDADASGRVLLVNDPEGLKDLLGGLKFAHPPEHQVRNKAAYALDQFVYSYIDPRMANVYWSATRWYRLADLLMIRRWVS